MEIMRSARGRYFFMLSILSDIKIIPLPQKLVNEQIPVKHKKLDIKGELWYYLICIAGF